MKRLPYILILASLCLSASAAGLSERVYVTTDRQVYVSGDRVWCSAFCIDAADGSFSELSSIAYLELHSAAGLVHTGKVALMHGRGASMMKLPADLPTGNYRLIAYTRQNLNEEGIDMLASARTISVFNPTSSARVENGVEIIGTEPEAAPAAPDTGVITLSAPASASREGTVRLTLGGAKAATLSVSVWHDDGLAAPANPGIAAFKASVRPGTSFTYNHIPEYEGEIIRGRVTGLSPEQVNLLSGYCAFISAPGEILDIYSSPLQSDGSVSFYTNNIYGDKDLVCEVEDLGPSMPGHIELESPFVDVPAGEIAPLKIASSMADRIASRGTASVIEQTYDADTLYEAMPLRENLLLASTTSKSYVLDDYTRFPTMEEVLVEFVTEMRARKYNDKRDIQILVNDYHESSRFTQGTSLMMIDGVPVFDHEKILSYDPLLVKSLTIYPNTHFMGMRMYEGMADFKTYKGNLPGVEFPANVRIVEFHGPSVPVAFTCQGLVHDGRYPDYRQTAYWHPMLDVAAGGSVSVDVVLPSYPGRFVVSVEGFDEDGAPVSRTATIEVK